MVIKEMIRLKWFRLGLGKKRRKKGEKKRDYIRTKISDKIIRRKKNKKKTQFNTRKKPAALYISFSFTPFKQTCQKSPYYGVTVVVLGSML